jgi:hypothetical protein
MIAPEKSATFSASCARMSPEGVIRPDSRIAIDPAPQLRPETPAAQNMGTMSGASNGRTTFAIDRSCRRFYTRRGEPVAQMVEHLTFNQVVLGSSPSGLTK